MIDEKMDEAELGASADIAIKILQGNGIVACPLLPSERFVEFCKHRDLTVRKERLLRFEHLGIFRPVFRVRRPDKDSEPLILPLNDACQWFAEGWAWDTTNKYPRYDVPDWKDHNSEAYYSVFQIWELEVILSTMTVQFHMDGFVNEDKGNNWQTSGERWKRYADSALESLRGNESRKSTALLCQFISDRYYPRTQGDQRTIEVPQRPYISDGWTEVQALDWDWHRYSKEWDPNAAAALFQLTPEKLNGLYSAISVTQATIDPLERWYQLVQFVDNRQRQKLKGSALHAETLRSGALMLGMLYKDLYGEDLPPPNEMVGQVITHVPEREIRADSRKYLEFVCNRYHLNPQPKLVLFVEGQSEEAAVATVFERYIGIHPGQYAIEIICLGGVETATGNKKEDRFRAILRLIDYLHHHQTFTFLILDNEGYAKRLKQEARKARSSHHSRRFITRPEYIKIWKVSFEFDNFSCTEIASAMETTANKRADFRGFEIAACKRSANPGSALSALYKEKTGYGLPKVKLNEALIEAALSAYPQRKLENRPLMKTLERVVRLASRNPLPTMQKVWEENQSSRFLGKKAKA